MKSKAPKKRRGSSLLEVMATMGIMAFGIVGLATAVGKTASDTRKNLRLTHGQMVAERVLEDLSLMGCTGAMPSPCAALMAKDRTARHYWVTAEGEMFDSTDTTGSTNPAGRNDMQYYHAAIDVDPPPEGSETGDPVINRPLAAGTAGNVVNVRVVVSWIEGNINQVNPQYQTAILQTRVSPGKDTP